MATEAILLAGGKAERLGDAAHGRPKALVEVAGRPLAEFQIRRLAAAGVTRVIVSCRAGQEDEFLGALGGGDVDVVCAGEPEPLGRGGGIKFAARLRQTNGPCFALNGDELFDVDLDALLAHHRANLPAATIAVAMLPSPFGVVDVADDDRVTGFREAPKLPHWVNMGLYVLDDEALDRFPDRGDHETSTFPELSAERRLLAFRHEGLWLTVNTPKDLRRAEDHFTANPVP